MNRLDVGGDDDMFSEEKILNALEQAFDKFDRDGNHWLGFTEFAQAWGELGLGRREDEIMRAYYKVDEDKSGSIDLAEFQEAILSEKVEELNVNIMVAKLGHELGLKLGDLHESAAAREARFKSFQMTAQRRRLLKKKMEEDLEKNLFLIVRKLCEMVGEEVPNLEERKVYDAMKQTFNAFDNDGSGQLNFSEFKEAWKFLQKPGSDALIKKSFDNQDVDGSLTVDSNEFAFALMGEEALKYGMLADIELLNKLLERLSGDVSSLASSVEVNKKSQEETARENEAIRMRLERLKRQHNSEMSKMIGEVTKLYSDGASGLEYMSEAQMDKILTDVFNKFDADGSGTMEFPEFKLAWKKELNLGGADMEIQRAFLLVDTDRSGVIELPEFIKAVKSERTPELNMKVIASNMGDSIKSLANYMQKYKEDYANMVSKAKRRRMNRSKFLRHLMERAEELLTKLEEVDNEARVEKDEVGAKLYKQLMETFDAFDKDGSGEMAFAEYQQAWRFLNQPGRQDAVRKAFDSVDVDRSGLVDRDEFVFSIMGQRAEQFGPIADMERLDALIDGLLELIENNRLELLNRAKTQEERDVENERLRARMKNQNEQLTKGMTSVMKAMMDITGDDMDRFMSSNDIDRYLTEAFNKYDKNGNGSLSLREFRQAWEYMNLGGGEEEIRKAFVDVDTDRSGVIEYPEFMRAIKDNRLDELGIGAVLGSIGVQMDDVLEKFKQKKGDFDKMKQTMRRRAKRSKEMIDNITRMLSKLMEDILDKNPEIELMKRDPEKKQLFDDLNDTFKAFDRDGNSLLTYLEYQEAWKFLNLPGGYQKCKEQFDSVDIDKSGTVDLWEFLFSIMGEEAEKHGHYANLEMLEMLLEALLKGEGKVAQEELKEALVNVDQHRVQVAQLQNEMKKIKQTVGGKEFNDIIQRMMFKVGVTRIGPLTNDELSGEIESAWATAVSGGSSMDRGQFREVINSKKMKEIRLRQLIAEVQADYWMEAGGPQEDDTIGGRNLAEDHTAEEALHLRSFLRTSALVIQFCRRIQLKFSHGDVDGSVKAAKALSHLLSRSHEELAEEVQRVFAMSGGGW